MSVCKYSFIIQKLTGYIKSTALKEEVPLI